MSPVAGGNARSGADAAGEWAVWSLDASGRIADGNPPAQRITGHSAEQLRTMPLERLWEDTSGADCAALLAAAAGSGQLRTTGRWTCQDGRRVRSSVLILAQKNPAGDLRGYTALALPTGSDMAEGGDARDSAAVQRAEKFDALSRLSQGLAHELNNIVQVMQNSLEIVRLRLEPMNPDVAKHLAMAQRSSERAVHLARDLLAFAGGKLLRPGAADLNAIVVRASEAMRRTLGADISLDLQLSPEAGSVLIDSAELEAVLQQLGANGRDAMSGRGELRIETRLAATADLDETLRGPHPVIAIRDRGEGMSAEIVARACEPYFTTRIGRRGAGLGLSLAYGFVKQSGGYLKIDSEPGTGTTVELHLPPATPLAVETADRAPGSAEPLKGSRVLVVEDEMLVGLLVEDLLGQLGCAVVGPVASMPEALDRASTEQIDLALLDINIQGERAYPVARILEARGVPVVFMSGGAHAEPNWRDRPVIQKPFHLAQMRRELHNALAGKTRC